MYVCMYVWMDGWMDGWIDGWMHVCMYVSMYLPAKLIYFKIPVAHLHRHDTQIQCSTLQAKIKLV